MFTSPALPLIRPVPPSFAMFSSVERMFACPARPPYVGRATTSQNDSAVSSSFSGDGRHRLRSIREEQLRTQPQTFTVPVRNIFTYFYTKI